MNQSDELMLREARQFKGAETLKRKWITAAVTGLLVWSQIAPDALLARSQNAPADQQKKETGASAAPQSGQTATPDEEYIEVERDTPFGRRKYRVPKSSITQPGLPGTTAPQVVQPPGANTPAQNTPAALSQAPQAGGAPQQATPSPTPAPGAVATPQTADNTAVPIALHLENADLMQVIGIIAAELKMNYVVDPAVKGTVNINTLGELRRGDLFPLLQMILRINGATAIQTGNFFRITPLRDAQRMPLDPVFNPDSASLPPDDRMVMNVLPLKYISAPDMTKILTPFLSEGGHLFSQESGNILLITDSSRSMKRLLEIIGMFDTEIFSSQRARLYQIKNSQAVKVAEDLKDIFSAYALSSVPAIRFIPIERINSILAVTANPGAYAEVEKWLEKLDHPLQESGIRNFVYKVENGKAADLAGLLMSLMGGSVGQPGTAPRPQTPGMPTPAPGAAPPPAPAPPAGTIGTLPEGSRIRIVADNINNQLVIQATAQEYEQIAATLKELDILPRQVMIEAKVYEVDLTGSLSAGVSAFLQNRDKPVTTLPDRKPLANFFTPQGAASAALNVTTGTLIGKTRELLLFLNAAESRNQARVISAPSVLAVNNTSANINVGTQIPVLSSQALVSGAQVSGSSLFTNTIQNIDTGVILTITPRINSSGLVTLQINQEVSAPVPTTTSAIQSPSIQKRSLSTQAVVQNRETIALGGIIQESRSHNRNRIPLLGDIPYLGALFGNTSISTQKTELIILITPTVITTLSEAQVATNELRDKLKDLRKILENEEKREEERKKEKE